MLKWKYRQKKRFFYTLMKLSKPFDWISTFFGILHNRIHMFFWQYWANLKFAELTFTEEDVKPTTVLPKVMQKPKEDET